MARVTYSNSAADRGEGGGGGEEEEEGGKGEVAIGPDGRAKNKTGQESSKMQHPIFWLSQQFCFFQFLPRGIKVNSAPRALVLL